MFMVFPQGYGTARLYLNYDPAHTRRYCGPDAVTVRGPGRSRLRVRIIGGEGADTVHVELDAEPGTVG